MAIVVANHNGPLAQWLEQRTQDFNDLSEKRNSIHTIIKAGCKRVTLQAGTFSSSFSGAFVESVKFGEA